VVLAALVAIPAVPAEASVADRMVAEINQARARQGLGALRQSGSINNSSASWARFLMRKDWLGHASLRAARVRGEVIEMHSGPYSRVARTVRNWLNSGGHRAILLSRSFHVVGAGKETGRFGGRLSVIWVARFR
jgi:uncharacterized protein YkwD